MPQDVESESELLNLAAVPYQIISPANNASIVGIFQDSLLGAYRITRDNINFNNTKSTPNKTGTIKSEFKVSKDIEGEEF